ncbi:LysR family transcriptional regulator [Streptomyces cellostaticus]|uniref:LysR family transcriptional regulator n=1 Tax=Streptomyces cellostaticus TaxID=67285 RepID=UPI00099E551A|nr:LysR family transcriptional regulator [Streptomyces cellostaticus]
MDLRGLRYFVTVAEEGNVGRAARRLHMSQPPLSQRIRVLEAELGCELFVRGPKGMKLTAAGDVLLEEAKALLAGAERARERVVQQVTGARVLRVGVLGPGEATLSAPVVAAFARSHPEAVVSLRQGDLADPTMGLAAGLIDVAITWTPFDETGLTVRAIQEDRCFAAVAARSPLAEKGSLTREDIDHTSSIRFPGGVDATWRAHWQPSVSGSGPEVHSLDECLHAVLWQQSIALVPESALERHAVEGITYRLVADVPRTRLVLARRRDDRSPLVTAYIEAFSAA